MMDPTIAIRLLQEAANHGGEWKATLRLARAAGSSYVGTSANQFYVVFVPVLETKHWWCVAYCVHEQEVWVIDSSSRAPLQQHSSKIDNISVALDTFFSSFDETWVQGQLNTWKRKICKVEKQQDGYSCGVYMLGAIKKCAEQYHHEFKNVAATCASFNL